MRAEIENWNSLQDINDAQANVREASAELLEELRQVLARHGAINKFGICLLHKHFDVEADEVLLETSGSVAKVLTIKPIKKTDPGISIAIPTIWSLGSEVEGTAKCRVVCFRDEDGFHEKKHWP